MIYMEKFDIIDKEIKTLFEYDCSGHDYWHTMRVYGNSLKIAENEDCDLQIVALAALLHDVDDVKLFETYDYENARNVMEKAGIADSVAEKVIAVIKTVPFRKIERSGVVSIEGKIVQDADRLDAMGAIGIARTFAYGGSAGLHMHVPDIVPNLHTAGNKCGLKKQTSVNHFYEKLFRLKDMMNTETARRIAEERDAFMHLYLEIFFNEWNGI